MNKNNNISGPFSHLPIFAEAMEDNEEIMRPLTVEDEMKIFYEKKYERKLKEYQQAFEQAKKQGIEQGRIAETLEMAKALKNRGVSIEIIAETSGLSAEEIDKL